MFLQVSSFSIKQILLSLPLSFSPLSLSRLQVAVPDLLDAAKSADILLFVIPHQFIGRACDTMKGKIKPDALGMSLIKVRTLVNICTVCRFLSYSSVFRSGNRGKLLSKITRLSH